MSCGKSAAAGSCRVHPSSFIRFSIKLQPSSGLKSGKCNFSLNRLLSPGLTSISSSTCATSSSTCARCLIWFIRLALIARVWMLWVIHTVYVHAPSNMLQCARYFGHCYCIRQTQYRSPAPHSLPGWPPSSHGTYPLSASGQSRPEPAFQVWALSWSILWVCPQVWGAHIDDR